MNYESEIELLISKSLDGELSQEEQKILQEHLDQCDSCKKTLDIFTRNEDLLKSALTVEVFGNNIVEGAINKIKDIELPTGRTSRRIVKQVEKSGLPAEASAQAGILIAFKRHAQLIAVAAMLAIFIAGVAMVHTISSKYEQIVKELRKKISILTNEMQNQKDEIKFAYAKIDEIVQKDAMKTVNEYLKNIPEPETTIAYVGSGLVVISKFQDRDRLERFDVYRRELPEEDWIGPLNKSPLNKPEYVDHDVAEGKTYEYKFNGYSRDGGVIESMPVRQTFKKDVRRDSNIFIVRCLDVDQDNKYARLSITKYIKDKPYSETFEITVGQQIGEKTVDIVTLSVIDFSTNYILERIETEDQFLSVTMTRKKFDKATGKPIIDPGTGKPVEEYEVVFLGQRQNKKLYLRKKGSIVTAPVELWKDETSIIPIE